MRRKHETEKKQLSSLFLSSLAPKELFLAPFSWSFPHPTFSYLQRADCWCWWDTEACWLSLECRISKPTSKKTTNSASSSEAAAGNICRVHRESVSPAWSCLTEP